MFTNLSHIFFYLHIHHLFSYNDISPAQSTVLQNPHNNITMNFLTICLHIFHIIRIYTFYNIVMMICNSIVRIEKNDDKLLVKKNKCWISKKKYISRIFLCCYKRCIFIIFSLNLFFFLLYFLCCASELYFYFNVFDMERHFVMDTNRRLYRNNVMKLDDKSFCVVFISVL